MYNVNMGKLVENFCSIDLEMNQPSDKIIQIGAVIGNLKTGEILAKYSAFVDPEESIREDIIKLCAIDDELLREEGMDLFTAYEGLRDLCLEYQCSKMAIQWGQGDVRHLLLELKKNGYQFNTGFQDQEGEPFIFGRRTFDAKQSMQEWRFKQGITLQGGLARSMTKLGLEFEGRKHTADADAYNTWVIYRKLLGLS